MRLFTTIAIAIGGAVAAQQGYAHVGDLSGAGVHVAGTSVEAVWEQMYPVDPADSLYRAGRESINGRSYRKAVQQFVELRRPYPDSQYVPDAMYWQAFALNQLGGAKDLRTAQDVLEEQIDRFPDAPSNRESKTLLTQIQGKLAKAGSGPDAEKIARQARDTVRCSDDDNEMRIAAIDALIQMNSEQAMPILKQVLAKRDGCSAELRRKAVFLVAQKQTEETESILLATARHDPDSEVREQAVFWLSNVHSDRALSALDSILRDSDDEGVQEKAIFAIANTGMSRGYQMLRTYAENANNPEELRAKAVFWLGQNGARDPQNVAFLRQLFDKTTDNEDIQNSIIQAMSQNQRGDDAVDWLMSVITSEKQPVETRKKALFWLGQRHDLEFSRLLPIYDKLTDEELREHFIFVLSQRRETAATDKLIQIAKSDKDKEMRKKAIFWLGQKNDPRAKQLLLEIINQ